MKKKVSFALALFVLGSVAAGYVVYVAGKETYRGRKIEKEIEALRQEAERIKTENGSLQEKIAYLDTDEFREKVAKEKLNLKKEDEKVVEIRPVAAIPREEAVLAADQPAALEKETENYLKWWNRFFRL